MLTVAVLGCQDNETKQNSQQSTKNKIEKKENIKTSSYDINPGDEEKSLETIEPLVQEELKPFMYDYSEKNPQTKAIIKTDFGEIEVELYEDTPLHRANFLYMANLGYFNTTFFYRVDKGFVIQAGNSDNLITGKMRKRIGNFLIPKEFKDNYKHDYGALAAAKFSKQNVSKASSPFEFYIVMDKKGAHHLNEEHTVFGRVVRGMSVAEKISEVKTENNSEWPVDNVEIEVEVLE